MRLFRDRAGASADAYYREALDRWRRMIRPKVWFVCGVWIALSPAFLYIHMFGQFVSGVWLGAGIVFYLSVWDEGPRYVENWREGRDGERATGRVLRKLKRSGWCCFHDLTGSEHSNIDHIAVGPGGVFLIDSKRRRGTLSVENGVLSCHYAVSPRNDYSMPEQPGYIAGAACSFAERLETELGWKPYVYPVMALWGDFPTGEEKIKRVAIIRGNRLADWLSRQPEKLAEADRDVIARVVQTFPRAT